MTALQPTSDDAVRIARECWDELQRERRRRGVPLRKLAGELRREFPQDGPAPSTLQDWLNTRQSLPDKLLFLELVRLLGLDGSHWADRWEQWDRARIDQLYVQNHADTPQPGDEPVDGPSLPTAGDIPSSFTRETSSDPRSSHRSRRRRVTWWGLLAGAAAVITSAIVAAAVTGGAPPAGDTAAKAAGLRCATVVTDRAEVFRNADGVDVLTVKQRGDQITLPPDTEDVTGRDGRRYCVVRTPTRTPTGRAYMLVETLVPTTC